MEGNILSKYPQFGALCGEEEEKVLLKLDGDESEWAGMDVSGKFCQNPHCQRFIVEV